MVIDHVYTDFPPSGKTFPASLRDCLRNWTRPENETEIRLGVAKMSHFGGPGRKNEGPGAKSSDLSGLAWAGRCRIMGGFLAAKTQGAGG
jgi:hypothetical protein